MTLYNLSFADSNLSRFLKSSSVSESEFVSGKLAFTEFSALLLFQLTVQLPNSSSYDVQTIITIDKHGQTLYRTLAIITTLVQH